MREALKPGTMAYFPMDLPFPETGHPRPRTLRRHLTANFLALSFILLSLLLMLWSHLPTITPQSFSLPRGVLLTDKDGYELYRFYREDDRVDLPLQAFPESLRNAVIAIEDRRFYGRGCVDVRALSRAMFANILDFKSQGASTITQQLLRNSFDLREKTFSRKILELLLACKMELANDKDGILELYLNHASFGGASFGAQEASHRFFGRDVRALTLAQSSVLAALLQRPTYLSPYGPHAKTTVTREVLRQLRRGEIADPMRLPEGTLETGLTGFLYETPDGSILFPGRADEVLGEMARQGTITAMEHARAQTELLSMEFPARAYPVSTPYFPSVVQRELASLPGVGQNCRLLLSGCKIVSTLDPRLQAVAETVVANHAMKIRERFHAENIALVAADRTTGQIVAYVGNVGYSDSGPGSMIDMARTPRQPGSTFKPFVYAAGFLLGYNPGSFLLDGPLWVGAMNPQNYEGGYHGWTSIRHALAGSRNIPAIRMFFLIGGEDPILRLAADAGITKPLETRNANMGKSPGYWFGYPLAIGAAETPLTQMVQGYATFANSGAYLPLTSIAQVRDGNDTVVYSANDRTEPVQVMPSLVAREITSILSDDYFRTTPLWKKLLTLEGIESAVKTGTSNQCARVNTVTRACIATLPTDVWTIGYTPAYVVGVWVGNATNQPLTPDADGLNVASPLWKEFLEAAHALDVTAQRAFQPYSTFDKRAKAGFYAPLPATDIDISATEDNQS